MEGGLTSTSSVRRRGIGKPPLIICLDCKWRRVVELKSKKPWSKGEIFYTCPNHKSDGTGCPFWHWEQSYYKYLEDHADELVMEVPHGVMVNAERRSGQKDRDEGSVEM
ncbi:unnamed protein product, partial [Urochloa humidicola]